jgi:hypothetical protein
VGLISGYAQIGPRHTHSRRKVALLHSPKEFKDPVHSCVAVGNAVAKRESPGAGSAVRCSKCDAMRGRLQSQDDAAVWGHCEWVGFDTGTVSVFLQAMDSARAEGPDAGGADLCVPAYEAAPVPGPSAANHAGKSGLPEANHTGKSGRSKANHASKYLSPRTQLRHKEREYQPRLPTITPCPFSPRPLPQPNRRCSRP